MKLDNVTYCLNAIKRISLLCNTQDELTELTGIPSLASNNNFSKVGEDKRYFLYALFEEMYKCYGIDMALDDFIREYEATSAFYTDYNLNKSSFLAEKENILEIMRSIFVTHELPEKKKLNRLVAEIYNHENDTFKRKNFNIAILFLLLYKVIPTFGGKKGYVEDIDGDYAKVKELLSDFCTEYGLTEDNLYIEKFERELKKGKFKLNRLALIMLVERVVYMIDASLDKSTPCDDYRWFELEGIWTDSKEPNVFYELTPQNPVYGMDAYEEFGSEFKCTRYCLEIMLGEDGLIAIVTHPRGRAKIVLDRKIGPLDMSTHQISFDDSNNPKKIFLKDIKRHQNYDFMANTLIKLDEEEEQAFRQRLETKQVIDKYEKYKTEYLPGSRIYAITPDYIYILPGEPEESHFLYQVPRLNYIDDGIMHITVDELAGVAVIAQDGPYIGFEIIRLYIDIRTDEAMENAGIRRVPLDDIKYII